MSRDYRTAPLPAWNMRVRHWLCRRHGHKFTVGPSGYYVGMPQSHCWRCGASRYRDKPIIPHGGWFS